MKNCNFSLNFEYLTAIFILNVAILLIEPFMGNSLKVILLCIILITPTVILFQGNKELTKNYEVLELNYVNLGNDMAKIQEENQQLDDELSQLIEEYIETAELLEQLQTELENINQQKINLEFDIQERINEILTLSEENEIKHSRIIDLNDELELRLNNVQQLRESSRNLESQILTLDENLEEQEQAINQLGEKNSELNENNIDLTKRNVELIVENDELNEENTVLIEDKRKLTVLLSKTTVENRDEIYKIGKNVQNSVAFVSTGGGYGTGFFISNDGCLLTNAHVTRGNSQVTVELSNGRTYNGEVIKSGDHVKNQRGVRGEMDLALVKVDIPQYMVSVPLTISIDSPIIHDTVILVGHPGELGKWVIATGSYNGKQNYRPDEHSFSLPSVFGGSSGSPIVNMNGEVIGVNWGSGLTNPIKRTDNIVVWKDNLGGLIMNNQQSLAETSSTVITFLSDTQCKV